MHSVKQEKGKHSPGSQGLASRPRLRCSPVEQKHVSRTLTSDPDGSRPSLYLSIIMSESRRKHDTKMTKQPLSGLRAMTLLLYLTSFLPPSRKEGIRYPITELPFLMACNPEQNPASWSHPPNPLIRAPILDILYNTRLLRHPGIPFAVCFPSFQRSISPICSTTGIFLEVFSWGALTGDD